MKNRWLGFFIVLGAFAFYLSHTAPTITAGDSGEFMTAAATLSLSHAPSYPLYTILARTFLAIIPWGSIPYRCNVFSALCSALAVFMFFLLMLRLQSSRLLAALLAAVIALTPSFWENALMTEVFALNSLWLLMLLVVLHVLYQSQNPKWLLVFSFLWGLGLGNHHVLLFVAPLLGCVMWSMRTVFKNPKLIGLSLLMFVLGFSIYLFLLIRSQKEPPLNWGQPTTVAKLMRTILRKDYGTMKLATGDQPERTFQIVQQQLTLYLKLLRNEMFWPVLVLGLFGLLLNMKNKFALGILLIFILSGPLFFLQSNLPMTAQTEGIMGRFFIMPVMMVIIGLCFLVITGDHRGPIIGVRNSLLGLLIVLLLTTNRAEAFAYRHQMLVWDYGQALLKTVPERGALYMDGGDDAFYSTAMLQYAMGMRPDIELHDRGGLVFKNPYGEDFRRLPAEEKKARRLAVENLVFLKRPLLYSTMDQKVLPNREIRQNGFLMQVVHPDHMTVQMSWDMMTLRSLHPLPIHHYRNRALAAFFPYMHGRQLFLSGNMDEAFRYFDRATLLGADVDWLSQNLAYDYSIWAFDDLNEGRFARAKNIYEQWLKLDPTSEQAISNLGVVYEREGEFEKARLQYAKAAQMFPKSSDPVFNLAVLAWKRQEWPTVIMFLEETLKRNPKHPTAAQFLQQAKLRLAVIPDNGRAR